MVGRSSQDLLLELEENNDFFDMLVDMIPSKLYIASSTSGEHNEDNDTKNKYYRKNTIEKEARKAAAKLAKRRKLDPDQVTTTTDLQKQMEPLTPLLPTVTATTTTAVNTADEPTSSPHASRIEALRAKLHAKIAEKQQSRPANPDQISKRAARRAEKKRRQEEAQRRQKQSTTKVTTTTNHHVVTPSDDSVMYDLTTLDFGRLAGLNSSDQKNYTQSNKALAKLNKTKNLQKMLADAQTKREKLERLQAGTEEEKTKAQNIKWTDTMREADGQRIKDDPKKIQKALKRRAAKKSKSQKAWKSRMEQTKAVMDKRQEIRQHNLESRKKGGAVGANLSKKEIVSEEKKKGRAGFEGRKQEFLNGRKD